MTYIPTTNVKMSDAEKASSTNKRKRVSSLNLLAATSVPPNPTADNSQLSDHVELIPPKCSDAENYVVIVNKVNANMCGGETLNCSSEFVEGDSWFTTLDFDSLEHGSKSPEKKVKLGSPELFTTDVESYVKNDNDAKQDSCSGGGGSALDIVQRDAKTAFTANRCRKSPSRISDYTSVSTVSTISCSCSEMTYEMIDENEETGDIKVPSFSVSADEIQSQSKNNSRSSSMKNLILDSLQKNSIGLNISELRAKSKVLEDERLKAAMTEEATLNKQLPIDFFGLSSKVKSLLAVHKGITELYDWQVECLQLPAIENRQNLIYTLPTSGGKTLIAEILILKELLCHFRDAILILPYVSIVQEKVRALSPFAVELGFVVEEYAGSKGQFPPKKRRKHKCVYAATIEKAHALVNSFIETNRLEEIGLVVVDELHMLGEGSQRGAILECTLAKIIFLEANSQIIGMSATLGNVQDLQTFLKAEIYAKDFRPVKLDEYVKIKDVILQWNTSSKGPKFKMTRDFRCPEGSKSADPDGLAGLVMEVIPDNSCLVFCPTKKSCENVAELICRGLPRTLKTHKVNEKEALLVALAAEGSGTVCQILRKTIPYGVAYHHSGLTMDERRLVEEGYSNCTLCCLACTSTLAAGVNLPAKRVILRSPYIGSEFLTRSRYKQMVGRAGRAGIDMSGESILIMKPYDRPKVINMLSQSEDQCLSSLMHGSLRGLKNMLLGIIGLEVVKNTEEIDIFFKCTLLAVQKEILDIDLLAARQQTLLELISLGLVQVVKDKSGLKTPLKVTQLGKAAVKAGVELEVVRELYKDLSFGLNGLILNTRLHLLYLVTPYNTPGTIQPQPSIYYHAYMKLTPDDVKVATIIGVSEAHITRVMMGQSSKTMDESIMCRFYATLILYQLWQQHSVWEVATEFQLHRGTVQNLLSNAVSFASCVNHFCQEFPAFWAYQALLDSFVKQFSYCVTAELLPLMELPSVKKGRASQLYKAGFKTLQDIAQAEPNVLVKAVAHLPRKVASEIVAAAKMLVLEKANDLQEQAEDLVLGLEMK